MHDPWTDRLSEYLDGELGPGDAQRLEAHLDACADCRALLADLRRVVARARALDSSEPGRDLWAGIAAAIAAPAASETDPDILPLRGPGAAAPAGSDAPIGSPALTGSDAAPSGAPRRRMHARSFSMSMPQMAAAALLLVTAGAGAAWMVAARTAGGAAGAAVANAPASQEAGPILFTSLDDGRSAEDQPEPAPAPRYDADVAALHRSLDEVRDQLDPATVDVVERSLESIDDAIATAQAALAADPGNPYLQRQLDGAMQKKLDVLRRASRVRRGAI